MRVGAVRDGVGSLDHPGRLHVIELGHAPFGLGHAIVPNPKVVREFVEPAHRASVNRDARKQYDVMVGDDRSRRRDRRRRLARPASNDDH